jgi:hypothetical protein
MLILAENWVSIRAKKNLKNIKDFILRSKKVNPSETTLIIYECYKVFEMSMWDKMWHSLNHYE